MAFLPPVILQRLEQAAINWLALMGWYVEADKIL